MVRQKAFWKLTEVPTLICYIQKNIGWNLSLSLDGSFKKDIGTILTPRNNQPATSTARPFQDTQRNVTSAATVPQITGCRCSCAAFEVASRGNHIVFRAALSAILIPSRCQKCATMKNAEMNSTWGHTADGKRRAKTGTNTCRNQVWCTTEKLRRGGAHFIFWNSSDLITFT